MIAGSKKKQCGHLRCGETCRLGKKPKKVYFLKRTPIKKKSYKLKRTRVNKVSKKRKEELKEYSKRREIFLKDNPVCQYSGCVEKATDVHHGAGRNGKRLLDFKKCKALCRKHHVWAEMHPVEAKEMGLSKSRLNKS